MAPILRARLINLSGAVGHGETPCARPASAASWRVAPCHAVSNPRQAAAGALRWQQVAMVSRWERRPSRTLRRRRRGCTHTLLEAAPDGRAPRPAQWHYRDFSVGSQASYSEPGDLLFEFIFLLRWGGCFTSKSPNLQLLINVSLPYTRTEGGQAGPNLIYTFSPPQSLRTVPNGYIMGPERQ